MFSKTGYLKMWSRISCQNNCFIYNCFFQLWVIKATATPVGLTHLRDVSVTFWISHWKPGPDTNMEIMKTGQLTVFVFDLVGVKRMFSLCKKLDKSCILGLKHLCLVLQLKPGAELTKTHYIPENIRNELQEVITWCSWFSGQIGKEQDGFFRWVWASSKTQDWGMATCSHWGPNVY